MIRDGAGNMEAVAQAPHPWPLGMVRPLRLMGDGSGAAGQTRSLNAAAQQKRAQAQARGSHPRPATPLRSISQHLRVWKPCESRLLQL